MRARRIATLVALAAAIATASLDDAAAARRRPHVASRLRHHFVFATPGEAKMVSNIGAFGGFFLTGIPGATTADPYERPNYGYDGHGYYGPGSAYPDF